ncbi:bile acid:sodium symporter family protein, partial [Neisseria sp. P0015.S010]
AIEVGVQNAGLATGLSAKFFPGNAESAVAAAVACVWHSVSGTVLGNLFAWWDKRKQ